MHGQQEGSAYNGHFETVCHHPLFLFNDDGDCLAAKLRPGNVHSADNWDELLVPEIEGQHADDKRVGFRADAAFAKPEIYEALEQRGVEYAIRMPANESLEWQIADLRGGPVASRWSGTRVSPIRRAVGPNRDGSWRKSSTMPANCSPASASS